MAETLKTAAEGYFRQGYQIVPFKLMWNETGQKWEKKPLIEWKPLEETRQTPAEFEALPWANANAFGIIAGFKMANGLYPCALDFDVKKLPIEIVEKGRPLLDKFRTTKRDGTIGKGQHLVYTARDKPKNDNSFHGVCGLEVIGDKKCLLMYPSYGYTVMNDNGITEIENINTLFTETLSEAGIQTKGQESKATWFDREDSTFKPYKGADPYCIRQLLKGVSEGTRNVATIRLSSYFVNFKHLNPYTSQGAWKHLRDWNKLNIPPLNETELKSIYDSAIKGEYNFGCEDDVLKSFCSPKVTCPLRKKQEKSEVQEPVFDQETEQRIEAAVNQICAAENQLEALKPHLDVLAVGEDNTKQMLTVLLRSAKEPSFDAKQIILLKATEGAGKSSLVRKLVQGYKFKEVGRFSAHALDYTNLEGFEILLLKELGSMDEEKQGVSTVKFLSSDDQGYTVEVTVKDEDTGRWKTEQYKIPAITVASSTTRLVLDPQFERRAWPLGLDETPQQTERIGIWKGKTELEKAEKELGLRKVTSYEFSNEVYKRFIMRYEPVKIIIPFPQQLLGVLGKDVLRVRGDFDKLLMFVKFYASFNLKRLEKDRGVYIVSPEVAYEGLQIALEPLSAMLSRIDKRSQQVFDVLKEIKGIKTYGEDGQEREELIRYDTKDALIDKALREKIAVKISKSEKTVRSFFNQLENSGYLSSDNKRPKTFTLLYGIEDIEKKLSGILAKSESANDLMDKMRKEAQEWRKTTLENKSLVEGDLSLYTNSNTYRDSPPTRGEKISNSVPSDSRSGLAEPSLEHWQIEKLPIESSLLKKTSENKLDNTNIEREQKLGLIACSLCKEQDKTVFFATQEDLRLHVSRLHSGYPDYVR